MRQLGILEKSEDAHRIAAHLVTLGITAHAEQEPEGWAVWVRDEDHLDEARQEFERFSEDPRDERYQGAEEAAESILREEIKRREDASKNVVEMRGRWGRGMARKAPLVFVIIALCVFVYIITGTPGVGESDQPNDTADHIVFVNLPAEDGDYGVKVRNFWHVTQDIRRGEVWRLITPIFFHLGPMHIIFNMFILYYFGAQIEDRRGSLRFLLIVLAIAVFSNVLQAWIEYPRFGGMSGVDYGLFGYVWMKAMYEPKSGMRVSPLTVLMLIGWFFWCLSGNAGPIANTGHGAGLLMGVAIGYAPMLFHSIKQQ